jgi:micrococcal nuclease
MEAGVGCLSGGSEPLMATGDCATSSPDVSIPSPPPDLNCGDVGLKNIRVVGSDPHRFDGDRDGVGYEAVSK